MRMRGHRLSSFKMDDERQVRQKLRVVPYHIEETVISTIADAVSRIQNSLKANYTSAIDPDFTERLDKALQKNLQYIKKKDAKSAQMLAAGKVEQPKFKNIPPPPVFTGKIPGRLGIGSSSLSTVPATSVDSANATVSYSGTSNNYNNAAGNSHSQEATSVYITNLPTDVSEEELEILFGPVGRIKKVKIYTTALGKQKGDALVTFVQAESAGTACIKFNGLDIGDGHVLSITRAEFGTAAKSAPESGTSTAAKGTGTAVTFIASSSSTHPHVNSRVGVSGSASASVNRAPDGSNRNDSAPAFSQQAGAGEVAHKRLNIADTKLMYDLLPGETEAGLHPVALIMNAFDPLVNSTADAGDSSDYFEELESDMLLECCKFGKVRTINLLTLTAAYLGTVGAVSSETLPVGVKGGTIAVTFESASCAQQCASALQGRRFDGRQLCVHVLLPHPPSTTGNSSTAASSSGIQNSESAQILSAVAPPPPPPPPPRFPKPATSSLPTGGGSAPITTTLSSLSATPAPAPAVVTVPPSSPPAPLVETTACEPNLQAIANDVDDFLSSLL